MLHFTHMCSTTAMWPAPQRFSFPIWKLFSAPQPLAGEDRAAWLLLLIWQLHSWDKVNLQELEVTGKHCFNFMITLFKLWVDTGRHWQRGKWAIAKAALSESSFPAVEGRWGFLLSTSKMLISDIQASKQLSASGQLHLHPRSQMFSYPWGGHCLGTTATVVEG